MAININIDTNLILVILGIISVAFIFLQTDLFNRYETKITKAKDALIGLMWVAKDEIVTWDISSKEANDGKDQDKIFNEFIKIFYKSNVLKYGGYIEKLTDCQLDLEKEIDRMTILLLVLIVPVVSFAFPEIPSAIGGMILYIVFIFIIMDGISIYRDIKFVNDIYAEYVLKREIFGGYDK